MVDVAAFLSNVSRFDDAFTVLDQAEALGAPAPDLLLMRGKLQLQTGRTAAAAVTLTRAHAAGIHDARLALLDAQLAIATEGDGAGDKALAILDNAATANPLDLAVQRARLDAVMKYEKWQAAERALDGLKQALYRDHGSVVEANVAAARLYMRLGRWTNALGEYRIALMSASGEVAIWMEYGRAAETAGRIAIARDAYAQAARLNPNNPEIGKALGAMNGQLSRLRSADPE